MPSSLPIDQLNSIEKNYGLEKSQNSSDRFQANFRNKSDRTITLCWINYKGDYVVYTKVLSQKTCRITTYCTHPWFAIDSFHNIFLLLNNEKTFVINSLSKDQGSTSLFNVDIHIPG